MGIANISGNILTDSGASLSSYLPLTGGTLTGALNGTSATFSSFVGINGSPATAFPLEAYINSSTAYSSTSRGNVMRVYNSNTGANVFAGIELGGAGTANDGLAGLNAVVTGSGSAALTFYTRDGGTFAERFRVSPSGNVGIGVIPSSQAFSGIQSLQIMNSIIWGYLDRANFAANAYVTSSGGLNYIASNFATRYEQVDGNHIWYNASSGTAGNSIPFTERMRITSGGKVLIGTSSVISGNYMVQASGNGGFVTNASNSGDSSYYSVTGTVGWHFYAEGGGSTKMYVLQNGDVRNANNSYGAISDISLKENITDATPKLADLLKVKVRNYNLIADEKKEKQLGVIAQELEEVFPNMISEDKKMGSDETIKTVKYSVFVPMLVKAIQEQQEIINNLSAKVTALENK